MKKLIINLAPTGMIPTKEITPHIPIHPQEIIKDVLHCSSMGASMIHIHARDSKGLPTYHKEIYAKIISGIREKRPDLIIVASTSGRNFPEFKQRSDVLQLEGDLKPDMASLTLSSLNFMQSASVNSPDMIMQLAKEMKEKGIKPELEVFDMGMVNYAKYLIKKGLIDPPYYFNILLGNIASAQSTLQEAGLILSSLPQNSIVSLTGLGASQKEMNGLGVIFADGVRVGLEDNIWLSKEENKLATNSNLVERVIKIANSLNRPIASANEVRELLGLDN
ncbi:BKACE family enzyme [Alkalihalobacterium elongatum]|uniref:3-keto-5-aminohexanoate cleavage protein n=1 Tax=Alkalihalobacterium elongatum TaxID=2675466 RepID=UPI001C1F542E|nr:3-keto-5-aminohexanoate cleavage protein [Alkalihalobacterium elongatum]